MFGVEVGVAIYMSYILWTTSTVGVDTNSFVSLPPSLPPSLFFLSFPFTRCAHAQARVKQSVYMSVVVILVVCTKITILGHPAT